MADGIRCRNCGRYEADHIERDEELPQIPGYPITLEQCVLKDWFDPEDEGLAKQLADKHAEEELRQKMPARSGFPGMH